MDTTPAFLSMFESTKKENKRSDKLYGYYSRISLWILLPHCWYTVSPSKINGPESCTQLHRHTCAVVLCRPHTCTALPSSHSLARLHHPVTNCLRHVRHTQLSCDPVQQLTNRSRGKTRGNLRWALIFVSATSRPA